MTNPKTRKSGRAPNGELAENVNNVAEQEVELFQETDVDAVALPEIGQSAISGTAYDRYGENQWDTSDASNTLNEEEEDDDDGDSSSSFSLQECMNEFRARRVRRVSSHSRQVDVAELDLINQNRSNKEHERKCKPCKDGFCYCFTSDSGDGGVGLGTVQCNAARGAHARYSRRNRKSEGSQFLCPDQTPPSPDIKKCPPNDPVDVKVSQSASSHKGHDVKGKSNETSEATRGHLTAISQLKASRRDAPLIHIIQELRDNCVISKVRVNKHKMQAHQRSRSLSSRPLGAESPEKADFKDARSLPQSAPSSPVLGKLGSRNSSKLHTPTAPTLEKIYELDPPTAESCVYSSHLNSSSKSNEKSGRKHKAGGRLLQKRLSNSNMSIKPRNLKEPPPKPPRSSQCFEDKISVSSLASTSPSVREAEKILDEFLLKNGVNVPNAVAKSTSHRSALGAETLINPKRKDKRKSYPSTPVKQTDLQRILPTYPSLRDIERVVESKKSSRYEKNIQQVAEKPIKEISFGWQEAKVGAMLSCDVNGNRNAFRSSAAQAGPQQREMGWRVPPKIDLDTVDGVRCNLASHLEAKKTPVKGRDFPPHKSNDLLEPQKFAWSKQLRHFSPWSNKQSGSQESRLGSNLCSGSHSFLKSSKKKILRLVSPKKENKERRNIQIRKTPLRTVGIQTSREDLRGYESSSMPQSPPGSYHSPMQSSSQQSSMTPTQSHNITNDTEARFDFSRVVHSPKKTPRSSQRKLNFPLNCAAPSHEEEAPAPRTYHSYNTELDNEATLSKMGYILNNIRAKLEASDEHAIRTFQEIERREKRCLDFDCTDGHRKTRQQMQDKMQQNTVPQDEVQDPIYSEIEEESIHILESPRCENHTGIEHFHVDHNRSVLYAKINKPQSANARQATSLGKFLQDSMRSKRTILSSALPPLSEPRSGDDSSGLPISHCQSLNNVRVMEHESAPKNQRDLGKSDLSLHRSEIFLENLCRSELVVTRGELKRLEKVSNVTPSCLSLSPDRTNDAHNRTVSSGDSRYDAVSYELPNDDMEAVNINADAPTAGSNLGVGVGVIAPPSFHNQSTPKKQSFTTKEGQNVHEQSADLAHGDNKHMHLSANQSNSCPTTPVKAIEFPADRESPHRINSRSLEDVPTCMPSNKEISFNALSTNTLIKYKYLKSVLRKSFRKTKDFVKTETKRLSTSLVLPGMNAASNNESSPAKDDEVQRTHSVGSSFHIDTLFMLDEVAPVTKQLAQAVSICRQLPELEISPEMVEAERLLLFSTLRRSSKRDSVRMRARPFELQPTMRVFVDDMRLPVRADCSQDIFFNYFYIVTFECDGVIKSTQSVECRDGEAIFRDCGIEFVSTSKLVDESGTSLSVVRGNVFMLRLRKVSTLSLEPRKPSMTRSNKSTSSPTSSSSSCGKMSSRFRLQASFSLGLESFVPYEYVAQESKNSERFCIRASCTCNIALVPQSRSSNLTQVLELRGRSEVRLPKRIFCGFLNVEDPHSQHNWNRRWCTLDGLQMEIWQDANDMQESPLFCLDLRHNAQRHVPLETAPRELCARPRSFCLQCTVRKAGEDVSTASIFFSTDTQADLDNWLHHLNFMLEFITKWL